MRFLDQFHDAQNRLTSVGLDIRGGFTLNKDEAVRLIGVDGEAGSFGLFLIGNLGGRFWSSFEASGIKGLNALDRWTKNVLDPIADNIDAWAFYPSDKPFQPFLKWAHAAEELKSSPLGLVIHSEYGLWHAYRAAFVIPARYWSITDTELEHSPEHPCESCKEKPCLHTCPVNAFQAGGYNVAACSSHVVSKEGHTCATAGCLARQSCPVGKRHEYSVDQQKFHMDAFID